MEGVKTYKLAVRKRTGFQKLKAEKKSSSLRGVGREGTATRRGKPQLTQRGSSRRLANVRDAFSSLLLCYGHASVLFYVSALVFSSVLRYLSPLPQCEQFSLPCACLVRVGTIFSPPPSSEEGRTGAMPIGASHVSLRTPRCLLLWDNFPLTLNSTPFWGLLSAGAFCNVYQAWVRLITSWIDIPKFPKTLKL